MTTSKRILYLTHRVPYPPDKGDRIRTFHTLRSLAQHHQVDLLALADEPVAESTYQKLQDCCSQVSIIPLTNAWRKVRMALSILTGGSASLTAFHSTAVQHTITQWMQTHQYDLLLASSSSVAPYLEEHARTTHTIVDLVDVDSEKWFNYASSAPWYKKWIYQREGQALRKYERHIARTASATLLVSEAETELFRKLAPECNLHTITNGVDLEHFTSQTPVPATLSCVFVGALDYYPNIDAVCWFASEVWPQVRQLFPQATFTIVGRKPVPAVQKLTTLAGVHVAGQVPDVRPYVQQARIVVAPLRIARGLQNKVLEALAMSRPVIASSPALAGLTTIDECPALRADKPSQWIDCFQLLFSDITQCTKLTEEGRIYVERHYSWEECLRPLHRLIYDLTTEQSVPQHALCETA